MRPILFLTLLFSLQAAGQAKFASIRMTSGYSQQDANGKTKDSVWDQKWYISNYKIVPETGLFVDTTTQHLEGMYIIQMQCIMNRKQVFCFGYTARNRNDAKFYQAFVDKKYLRKLLRK